MSDMQTGRPTPPGAAPKRPTPPGASAPKRALPLPLNTLLWVAAAIGTLLVIDLFQSLTATIVVMALQADPGATYSFEDLLIIASAVVEVACIAAFGAWWLVLRRRVRLVRRPRRSAAPTDPSRPAPATCPRRLLRRALAVTCLGCGLQIGISTVLNFLLPLVPELQADYSQVMDNPVMQSMTVAAMAVVALAAPVAEEIVFRGIAFEFALRAMHPAWRSSRAVTLRGLWAANVIQALLFGIFHMNVVQGVYAFAIGLVLGWIAWRTGGIATGICVHLTVNLASYGVDAFFLLASPLGMPGCALIGAALLTAGVVLLRTSTETPRLASAARGRMDASEPVQPRRNTMAFTAPIDATKTPAWEALRAHHDQLVNEGISLKDWFAADPDRVAKLSFDAGDLHFDLSKNLITDETVKLLADLGRACGVEARRDAMFAGEHINTTEDRAVLHTALRRPASQKGELIVDGQDVVADVHEVLDRMYAFADKVRSGEWKGVSGKRIEHLVSIGIGGSDLGPVMAYEALKPYADAGIDCRYISNIDPNDQAEKLRGLDPETTLVIIVSKTFTTLETLTNAREVKAWMLAQLRAAGAIDGTPEQDAESIAKHFVAVSTALDLVADFGIDPKNAFGFWSWVGGRYSVGSAVGLSLIIVLGPERFQQFLAGFRAIDEYFESTPLEENEIGRAHV